MGKVVQKKPFPVFTVFCIVMAVLIAVAITVSIVSQNGVELRNKTVIKVDDVTVSGLDFQYAYMNYVNNYYSYYLNMFYSYFGVTDFNQKSIFDSSKTWYQYAAVTAHTMAEDNLETIVDDLKNSVCLYVDAKAKELELSEENVAAIESTVASMKLYAKQQNLSFDEYLGQYYATGFKEKDLRKMLELTALASQNSEAITGAYTFTDDQREEYYAANRSVFDNYTYYVLTIATKEATASDGAESDGAENTEETGSSATSSDAAEKTYTKAEAIAYLNGIKDEIAGGKTFTEAAGDKAKKISGVKYDSLTDDAKVKEWLAKEDRKANDIEVVESDASVSLVMFVDASRDEYKLITANMGELCVEYEKDATDEEKAAAREAALQSVTDKVNAWKEGNGTRETFIAMAKEIDTDLTDDGLIENLIKGYFGDEFDEWAFDPSRSEGDTLVFGKDDDVFFVYFVSQNDVYWKHLATEYLTSDKYNDDLKAIVDDLASKTTVDKEAAKSTVQ